MVFPSARRQDHSITSESPLKLCSWYFQHLQAEKICFGPQTEHIDRVKLNVLPTILTNFSFSNWYKKSAQFGYLILKYIWWISSAFSLSWQRALMSDWKFASQIRPAWLSLGESPQQIEERGMGPKYMVC